MAFKRNRILPIIIFMWAGITLMVIPSSLYVKDYIREIMYSLGMVLMISGVIWFFFDKIENRLNRVFDLFTGPMAREINELKLIYGEDIYKVIRKSIGMYKPKIIVEYRTIGRWTYDFIDYLSMKTSSKSIKLLITGYGDSKHDQKPEIEMFFKQLKEIQNRNNSEIEIRNCSNPSNNTYILSITSLFIIVPFDPKGKNLIYIDTKPETEIFYSYERHFDEMWEKSEKYSG